MVSRLIMVAIVAGVVSAIVVAGLPDIKRYMEIRKM
jgi:hypothetical protein